MDMRSRARITITTDEGKISISPPTEILRTPWNYSWEYWERNRGRKEKNRGLFTKTVMEILITGTINIHKEETGKSVEALTGRGGKREINPGTWILEQESKKNLQKFLSNGTPREGRTPYSEKIKIRKANESDTRPKLGGTTKSTSNEGSKEETSETGRGRSLDETIGTFSNVPMSDDSIKEIREWLPKESLWAEASTKEEGLLCRMRQKPREQGKEVSENPIDHRVTQRKIQRIKY
jgi:hypothetical protein